MNHRWARAIAYGAVALLAVAAILFSNPLPSTSTRPAGEVLSAEHEAHRWRERNDTLGKGETLVAVLARGGLSHVLAREAVRAAKTLDWRTIKIGMPVRVRSEITDSIPTQITLQLAVDRFLHL